MTLDMIDGAGKWLGIFGPASGADTMTQKLRHLPATVEFLDTGEADAALLARILVEARRYPPEYKWFADILRKASQPPVVLTDGVVDKAILDAAKRESRK